MLRGAAIARDALTIQPTSRSHPEARCFAAWRSTRCSIYA
jgi:hypothetical protein